MFQRYSPTIFFDSLFTQAVMAGWIITLVGVGILLLAAVWWTIMQDSSQTEPALGPVAGALHDRLRDLPGWGSAGSWSATSASASSTGRRGGGGQGIFIASSRRRRSWPSARS